MSTTTPWVPDEPASKEELLALAARMRAVSNATYDLFFTTGMGADVHAFIEFCGLLSKYCDICERCAEQGIDFRLLNTHSGQGLPVEKHDMRYLGEKLDCIFGPAIHANRAARAALREMLFGEREIPDSQFNRLARTLEIADELRRDGYHVIVRDSEGRVLTPEGVPE
jgi:hypothetical protein